MDIRILIVEDDEHIGNTVNAFLSEAGYRVDVCRDGHDALQRIYDHAYQLVVLGSLMRLQSRKGGKDMGLQRKNYEIVADELRRLIEAGRIPPEEKLESIERLAARYRVGRSTVREALSQLKALGLVESRQGGGTYVKARGIGTQPMLASLQASKAELSQVLQVRKMLEVGAAALAARHRTAEDVARLVAILGQMRDADGREEIGRIYDADYHLAIAQASGNAMLATLMTHVSEAMSRAVRQSRDLLFHTVNRAAGQLFEEHEKLFEAIRDGDPDKAASTMERHLAQVETALQSV